MRRELVRPVRSRQDPADIVDRLNKSAALAVQSHPFKKLGVNEGLVVICVLRRNSTDMSAAKSSAGAV